MKADEFKKKVGEMLGSDIKFDGHINQVVNNIIENRQKNILDWIKGCKSGVQIPEPCKKFKNLISFIYKSNDNRIRGILTKKKNSFFVELFLDKNKYYDQKKKYLGI